MRRVARKASTGFGSSHVAVTRKQGRSPLPTPPTHTHTSTLTRGSQIHAQPFTHTHSRPLRLRAPLHAATSRRPEVEAVPPHQRLVAGEVGSLSSNGTLPVASSSKSWIAPSRAPSKGRVRDSLFS